MNEMRKLIEAVEQLDDNIGQDRRDQELAEEREFAAFVYGVQWGNSAQYNDGGYDSDVLPREFNDWVEGGRKGLHEDTTDIQYPSYDEYEGELSAHIEAINSILQTGPNSWHAAIKVVKQIMDDNNIIPGDLE